MYVNVTILKKEDIPRENMQFIRDSSVLLGSLCLDAS